MSSLGILEYKKDTGAIIPLLGSIWYLLISHFLSLLHIVSPEAFHLSFDAGGSEVATSGTNEESSEAGAGNDTDSGRKIILEAITRYCGEKYETDSKNVTFADTKYFLIEGL